MSGGDPKTAVVAVAKNIPVPAAMPSIPVGSVLPTEGTWIVKTLTN